MKLTRVLAGAALVSAAAASTARADFKDFSNRCTPGVVRACASLTVFTTPSGSGTTVVIMVRNLQGTSPYPADNTGGSLIQRIGLVAPTIAGASNLVVSTTGSVGTFGAASGIWLMRTPGTLGSIIELDVSAGPSGKPTNGGIIGCSASRSGLQANYYSTCGASAGWVVFTFSTSNAWSASGSDVAILFDDFKNSSRPGGIECDTQPGIQSGRADCFVATPEPVTMILLGSGLASMGGFGLVRRRKGTDVSSD